MVYDNICIGNDGGESVDSLYHHFNHKTEVTLLA